MKLTDPEWKLMKAVWAGHPATARDVMRTLEGEADWAYTTVKTMLSRLVEKGALRVEMRGNTSFYEPLLTEREARRSALRMLLDSAFDGAFGPMMHFLVSNERLSKKDREALRRLLEEKEIREGRK